jgi:hypothetical protein
MDWRFVGDVEWKTICDQLNGAGVPSMQAKWTELFSLVEEVKVEMVVPVKKHAVRRLGVKAKSGKGKKKDVVSAKSVKTKAPEKKNTVKKVKAKPEKKSVFKTKPVAKKGVATSSLKVRKPVKKSTASKEPK